MGNKKIDQSLYSGENKESFNDALNLWLQHKKERKESYKPTGLKMLKNLALELGTERFINAVKFSITNNYCGLFEPPQKINNNNGRALKDYGV